jgi:dihydrofolate reductase
MGKIIVSEFISLDGVIEEPAWTVAYWNDEIAKFKYDELFSVGALLLGRKTYEGFAEAWPGRTDEQGYAGRMNSLPKYVVSTSLTNLEWNNSRLVNADLEEKISQLKQTLDQDLLIFGSGTLVQSLIKGGLIDRYHLLIYPLVLGSGKRLFRADSKATLKLVETKTTATGVTALIYQTA